MLSQQPNVLYSSHPFLAARSQKSELLSAGPLHLTDLQQRQEMKNSFDKCYELLERFFSDAEKQGKSAFVHSQPHSMLSPALASQYVYGEVGLNNHLGFWGTGKSSVAHHSNPTVLPDEILLHPGTKPIITFRHPVLMVDGVYRGWITISPDKPLREMSLVSTLHWSRLMYDWFLDNGEENGIKPILLDADDYIGPQKEAVMEKVCAQAGLDSRAVIYTWQSATPEELAAMPPLIVQVKQTLLASDGVMPEYAARERNLDKEMASWTEKYGEEVAQYLRELVAKTLPDYNYMHERRLRPS